MIAQVPMKPMILAFSAENSGYCSRETRRLFPGMVLFAPPMDLPKLTEMK